MATLTLVLAARLMDLPVDSCFFGRCWLLLVSFDCQLWSDSIFCSICCEFDFFWPLLSCLLIFLRLDHICLPVHDVFPHALLLCDTILLHTMRRNTKWHPSYIHSERYTPGEPPMAIAFLARSGLPMQTRRQLSSRITLLPNSDGAGQYTQYKDAALSQALTSSHSFAPLLLCSSVPSHAALKIQDVR